MDIWKQPGQYSLEVPSSWAISEIDDTTELVPENGDAAIHISVFRKQVKSFPQPGDAAKLVGNFAQKNDLRLDGELTIQCNENRCACFGRFEGSDKEPDQPGIWFVKGVVGLHKAVLGTFCLDEPDGRSYVEGLAILDSLELEEV